MNTEDRELLELAAKAAGYGLREYSKETLHSDEGRGNAWMVWNPLRDDGDALRMAVRLGMLATYSGERFELFQAAYRQCLDEDMKPSEATRRAIVRAAAEIGRRMA